MNISGWNFREKHPLDKILIHNFYYEIYKNH